MLVVLVATVGGRWPAALAAVAGFALAQLVLRRADPHVHDPQRARPRRRGRLPRSWPPSSAPWSTSRPGGRRRRTGPGARPRRWPGMAGSLLRKGDPLPELLANLVALFRLDHAAVVRVEPDAGGAAPRPARRPTRAATTLTLPLTDGVELARRRARPAGRRPRGARRLRRPARRRPREPGGCRPRRPTAEALMQGNELRTALLAAVSHDLRTPLASIKASSSSLLSADVSLHRRAGPRPAGDDRRGGRPAQQPGREPARHEPDPGRRARGEAARPVGLDEVVGGALSGLRRSGPRHPPRRARDAARGRRRPGAARAGDRQHRRQRPALRARRARPCASRPAPSPAASTCGSSTPAPASRRTRASEVFRAVPAPRRQPRTAPASGSAWPWPAASSSRWAAS